MLQEFFFVPPFSLPLVSSSRLATRFADSSPLFKQGEQSRSHLWVEGFPINVLVVVVVVIFNARGHVA